MPLSWPHTPWPCSIQPQLGFKDLSSVSLCSHPLSSTSLCHLQNLLSTLAFISTFWLACFPISYLNPISGAVWQQVSPPWLISPPWTTLTRCSVFHCQSHLNQNHGNDSMFSHSTDVNYYGRLSLLSDSLRSNRGLSLIQGRLSCTVGL